MAAALGVVTVVLSAAPPASADALWVTSGGGSVQVGDIQFLDIEGNQVLFKTRGGEARRDLSQVVRIEVEGEPALNTAEQAFIAGRFDAAVDGYLKTVRSTNRNWLKRYGAERLIESAAKSKRFDAAVVAYLTLVRIDPELAASRSPELPVGGSGFLPDAATELETALSDAKLTPEQKQLMLALLLEIQKARGEAAAAAEVAEQMLQLESETKSNPAAAAAIADLKLDQAREALGQGDFQKALDLIQANRGVFREPRHQAAGQFLLAEARYGLLGAAADPAKLQDVALEYMRVVAHFEDSDRDLVPTALMRTAQIHERLGEKQVALSLYEQFVSQYKSDPSAQTAMERAAALRADLVK